jgi:hypothetical protein
MRTTRAFVVAAVLAFATSTAGAQKFVRQDSIRSLPMPVLLDGHP